VVVTARCSIKFACTCTVQFHYKPMRARSFLASVVILIETYDWNPFDDSSARCKSVLHASAENRVDVGSTRLPLWRKHRSPVKTSLINVSLSNSSHLMGFQLIRGLKSNPCAARNRQNTIENNTISSHAQVTTAFQPNLFLNGTDWLLVMNI
jgi:hypothetical protein